MRATEASAYPSRPTILAAASNSRLFDLVIPLGAGEFGLRISRRG